MRKLIFLLIALAAVSRAQTHTYPALDTNNTFTGNNSFVNINNRCMADAQLGSDAGAKIAACIAYLPSTGGVIDASGLQGAQSAAATITINKQILLIFGATALTLSGNPGINVAVPGVTIAGASQIPQGTGVTVLKSGGAYPLIANYDISYHGANSSDNLVIRDLVLDGNTQTGMMGLFLPGGYFLSVSRVIARNFKSTGLFNLGGIGTLHDFVAAGNSGDGAVWGYDGGMDGLTEFNGNGADGLHLFSGGTRHIGVATYANGLHGVHADGATIAAWVNSAIFVEPKIILPACNNAGGYYFYTEVAGTAGGSCPTFPQAVGATVVSGGVTFVNVGLLESYASTPGIELNVSFNSFVDLNSTENNTANASGEWDEILIEGNASTGANNVYIDCPQCKQAQVPGNPAGGVHLKYAQNNTVANVQWWGGAWPTGSNIHDYGGLILEHANITNIGTVTCFQSWNNCVTYIDSYNTSVLSVIAVNGALSSTPSNNTYVINVDTLSNLNTINNLRAYDSRGTPYMKGVLIQGSQIPNTINHESYGPLSAQDSGPLTTGNVDGITGSLAWVAPSGAGHSWYVNGTQIGGFNSSGFNIASGSLSVGGTGVIDASRNGSFAKVTIGGTNTAPVVATPTVGQAACIYAAGPPVQIGKCTTVVSSTGACTCAP